MPRKMSKFQLEKYRQFVKAWPDEFKSHGHATAALGCLGFTFNDDIERLQAWLADNHPQINTDIEVGWYENRTTI